MRKYRTNGDNSSNKARSYDDNDINCLVCDKKLTQEEKKDIISDIYGYYLKFF